MLHCKAKRASRKSLLRQTSETCSVTIYFSSPRKTHVLKMYPLPYLRSLDIGWEMTLRLFPQLRIICSEGKVLYGFCRLRWAFEYLIKSINYFIVYWRPCCLLDAGRVSFLRGSTTRSGVQMFTFVAVIKRIQQEQEQKAPLFALRL